MIDLNCSQCGKKLKVAHHAAGKRGKCPWCGAIVRIPENQEAIVTDFAEPQAQLRSSLAPSPAPKPPDQRIAAPDQAQMVFCPKCGGKQLKNNYKCTRCGFVLFAPTQPQYAVTDHGTMGGLIPYKNARALWAYYLAVFSLIPCVGIPLGVAALALGIQGLKFAELRPEAKGKAHAWTGIILGALTAIGYTVLVVVTIIAART